MSFEIFGLTSTSQSSEIFMIHPGKMMEINLFQFSCNDVLYIVKVDLKGQNPTMSQTPCNATIQENPAIKLEEIVKNCTHRKLDANHNMGFIVTPGTYSFYLDPIGAVGSVIVKGSVYNQSDIQHLPSRLILQ